MKYFIWFSIVLLAVSTSIAATADDKTAPLLEHKSSAKKPSGEKAPRSLLAVDPYDAQGKGVDPNDVEGEIAVDPYDAELLGNTIPGQSNAMENETDKKDYDVFDFETPELIESWSESIKEWRKEEFTPKPKPPMTWDGVGSQLGAGYVGAFGGSVLGLFGGFLIGTIYDELADCRRCWIDVATTTSVIGASLLTSSGVYVFGNTEEQLGSIYQTTAASLIPVVLAMGLYNESTKIQKSGFYILSMPIFATLGYNFSRYYRRPGEKSFFDDLFLDDGWVSVDPMKETLAFNVRVRF